MLSSFAFTQRTNTGMQIRNSNQTGQPSGGTSVNSIMLTAEKRQKAQSYVKLYIESWINCDVITCYILTRKLYAKVFNGKTLCQQLFTRLFLPWKTHVKSNFITGTIHGKNGFAKKLKILAGYRKVILLN